MKVVARFFVPTDAFMLKACLESNGLDATVADANLVQVNEFLTTAVGGVRVLVPDAQLERAQEILRAYEAGEYRLDDDFDVGKEVQ